VRSPIVDSLRLNGPSGFFESFVERPALLASDLPHICRRSNGRNEKIRIVPELTVRKARDIMGRPTGSLLLAAALPSA